MLTSFWGGTTFADCLYIYAINSLALPPSQPSPLKGEGI